MANPEKYEDGRVLLAALARRAIEVANTVLRQFEGPKDEAEAILSAASRSPIDAADEQRRAAEQLVASVLDAAVKSGYKVSRETGRGGTVTMANRRVILLGVHRDGYPEIGVIHSGMPLDQVQLAPIEGLAFDATRGEFVDSSTEAARPRQHPASIVAKRVASLLPIS